MMSMSGSWFFVVASEAIQRRPDQCASAGHRLLHRARRSSRASLHAIGWAIAHHADRHPALRSADLPPAGGLGRSLPGRPGAGQPYAADLLGADHAAALAPACIGLYRLFLCRRALDQPVRPRSRPSLAHTGPRRRQAHAPELIWFAAAACWSALALWRIALTLIGSTTWREAGEVAGLAAITMLRVIGPDRARQRAVGADRHLGRPAPARHRRSCSRSRSSWRRFRPICCSRWVAAHRQLEPQSGRLAESADDPRHAVVHPVQRDRGRLGDAARNCAT